VRRRKPVMYRRSLQSPSAEFTRSAYGALGGTRFTITAPGSVARWAAGCALKPWRASWYAHRG
jgi:hypothetical protein